MSSIDSIHINMICWYVLPRNEIFYIIPKECLFGKSGRHIESCRCWKSTTLGGADIICCKYVSPLYIGYLILGFAEKIPIHYRSGPGKKPAIPAAANVHDLGLGHDPVGGGDDDDGAQSRESRSAQLKVQKTATFLPGQCISTAWKPFQEKDPPVFVPFGSSAWCYVFTHLPHIVADGKGMDFLHDSFIPCRKCWLPCLGKAAAAARAALPIPTCVGSIFVCPNSGVAASVWDI